MRKSRLKTGVPQVLRQEVFGITDTEPQCGSNSVIMSRKPTSTLTFEFAGVIMG